MFVTLKQKFRNMVEYIKNIPTKVKDGLHTVPTTNLMSVTAIAMSVLSLLLFWLSVLLEKTVDPINLGLVFTFLGSWLGINTRQFRIKRETHFDYQDYLKQKEKLIDRETYE